MAGGIEKGDKMKHYALELARISVQPQNYSDENWDEAMALCVEADAEISALKSEILRMENDNFGLKANLERMTKCDT